MSFTFGRTTSTTNYGSASTDYKYASRYYLAKPGYLQSLTALVSVDGGGSAPTRLFIYDIDGDAYPDALLGSTTAQTIPARLATSTWALTPGLRRSTSTATTPAGTRSTTGTSTLTARATRGERLLTVPGATASSGR
jgi:hypothetical protein